MQQQTYTITIEGKPRQCNSASAIMINQVFDEEIAKITDKNIKESCKKSK